MRERRMLPNSRLRALLLEYGVQHCEIADAIGRNPAYVSSRMTGKQSWTMDDAYAIRDFVNTFTDPSEPELIPLTTIHEYFPPRPKVPYRRRASAKARDTA